MKKNQIILAVLATSLSLGQPMVAQEQTPTPVKSRLINRAKKEWREFKEARKCLRQKGFRGCSRAQKKRIIAAGVALAVIVVGMGYGVKRGVSWRQRQMLKNEWKKADPEIILQLEGKLRTGSDPTAMLFAAVEKGNAREVRALLVLGANKEFRDRNRNTPLHVAALGGDAGVVRALLAMGANKESRRKDGLTPLYLAASGGHAGVVRALLAEGANTESRDGNGLTPLHAAAFRGHDGVVRELLTKGADTQARTLYGITPLEITRDPNVQSILEEWETRKEKA